MKRRVLMILGGASLALGLTLPGITVRAEANHPVVLLRSAQLSANEQIVTLPLYQGTSCAGTATSVSSPCQAQTVYFVLTDTSDRSMASRLGLNDVPKLANAANTNAVQDVTYSSDGTWQFPATVAFRVQTNDPTTSPPHPGSIGNSGYSPLVQLPDGSVVDAPQVGNVTSNGTVWADKVVSANVGSPQHVPGPASSGGTLVGSVEYRTTTGFFAGQVVHYASFDASANLPAALEDVTVAPKLAAAPFGGDPFGLDTSSQSAVEGIIPIANGQRATYAPGSNVNTNPNRQGVGSAVAGEGNPLNIVHAIPALSGHSAYSPLWDIHVIAWNGTPGARQTDYDTIAADTTGPGGTFSSINPSNGRPLAGDGSHPAGSFERNGAIANCPLIALDPQLNPSDPTLGTTYGQ